MAEVKKYIRTVKNNGDIILSNILDSTTGESVEYIKIDPTGITPEGVIYRQLNTAEFGLEIFKRIIKGSANIKWWGAISDGNITTFTGTDNKIPFENAFNVLSGLGIPLSINGNYLISPLNIEHSNLQIDLSKDTNIISPNLVTPAFLITIPTGVDNITINGNGANIVAPSYIEGEQRHNLLMRGCSNIVINDLNSIGGGGDGFYLGNSSTPAPTNITLNNCKSIANRRNGISIVNGDNILVYNHESKDINGTLPMAGLDIEPNSEATAILNKIRIINMKTSNCGGSGIDSALSSYVANAAKKIDIIISGHTSIGDGGLVERGGYRLSGNGYGLPWANKCYGTVIYENGYIQESKGSGIQVNAYDPNFAPSGKISATVVDPGVIGSQPYLSSGVVLYSGTGATFPTGNVDIDINVIESRTIPKTYSGAYLYNTSADLLNFRLNIDCDPTKTTTGRAITQLSNVFKASGEITYKKPFTYIVSGNIGVIQYTGATMQMSAGGVLTLPSVTLVNKQRFRIVSNTNSSIQIQPFTGDLFPTSHNNTGLNTVLSYIGDSLDFQAIDGVWVVKNSSKGRILFTNATAPTNLFYTNNKPGSADWLRGDLFLNTTGLGGYPVGWYTTQPGTPGIQEIAGFINPIDTSTIANADITLNVGAGYRTHIQVTNLTANRNVTLSNTNAFKGNSIRILRKVDDFSFFKYIVKNFDGVTLYNIEANGWAEFTFDGTNWLLTAKNVGIISGVTASRPNVTTIGTEYFDVTLGKPIWWNGTVWKDATGATV